MKKHTLDKGYAFERAVVGWIAERIDNGGDDVNHSQMANVVLGGTSAASNWRNIRTGRGSKPGRLTLEMAYRFIVALGEDPASVLSYISQSIKDTPLT